MATNPKQSGDDLWRKLTLPEEDRRAISPWSAVVSPHRWFRSENVVDLLRVRRQLVADRRSRIED